MRRRLGWDVIRAAALGGVPREIELLTAAVTDLPIPLTLPGGASPARPPALVRVRLHVPGARRAALEIVRAPTAPVVDYLEQGVRLLRAPLDAGTWLPRDGHGAGALPIRVWVDADVLPTNASRSALREDAPLPRHAAEAALDALADATRALAAVAGIGSQHADAPADAPADVEILTPDPLILEDALGAITCALLPALAADAAGAPPALLELLDLPLLRDAVGRPLSVREVQSFQRPDRAGEPPATLHVFRGAAPLPEELGPWMRRVIWLRGRAVERLLEGLPTEDAAPRGEQARVGAERRRRLLGRAAGTPVLPARLPAADGAPAPIQAAFDVREGDLAGLRGEVALLPDGAVSGRIHAFVEGRLLETIEIGAAALPLPVEAAIAWEGRLQPRPAYDGVERDRAFARTVHYAALVAIFALDREVTRVSAARDEAALARLRPAARAAIGTILTAEEGLGLGGTDTNAPRLAAFKGLYAARVWPTTEPGRRESVMSLGAFVERRPAKASPPVRPPCALMTARPDAVGRAADGRPVVTARPREIAWLTRAWHGTAIVPYEHGLIPPGMEAARDALAHETLAHAMAASAAPGAPVLAFARPGARGLVAASADPRLTLCHAGRVLASNPVPPELGPIALAIDDDSLVPTPAWDAPSAWPSPDDLAAVEREHCEQLVAAMEGDPHARARLGCAPGDRVPMAPAVRAYLLDRALHLRRDAAAGAALADRIEGLPLVTMLDESGAPAPASLAAVARAHPRPRPIPVLRAPPGFETLDWCPLLAADTGELVALAAWSGGRAMLAEAAIPARRARALADHDRRAFLSGPEHDPRALGDLAPPPDAGSPSCFLDAGPDPSSAITVAIGLPRAGLGIDRAWVDVLFQGRGLCRRALPSLPLPVVARVSLADEAHVSGWRDLSDEGVLRVTERVHAAATGLALEIVRRASGPERGASLFGDLGALRLVLALRALERSRPPHLAPIWPGDTADAGALVDGIPGLLRAPPLLWPTVQGEPHRLDALRKVGDFVYVGHARHVPWRSTDAPTELDDPILHLPEGPEGDALAAILDSLGLATRDVTAALAALAARRAAGSPQPRAPRLPGAPAHPALRVTLADLGARFGDGELEILEAPPSDVTLIDLAGAHHAVKSTLPFPVRAVVRIDSIDTSTPARTALLKKLTASAGKHLLALVPRLDTLPDFVRAHLRGVVCRAVEKQKKPVRRATWAKAFPDLGGTFHTYADLAARTTGTWECTNDPSPYPASRERRAVLRLTEPEMRALANAVPLKNLTTVLRRELEGERRAAAAQLAEIALDPETRARCLAVVTVDEAGVTGEVGLLAPEHGAPRGARGLSIFVTRRPLCRIKDGPGWPIAAALNDDATRPNRAFDGLLTTRATVRLQTIARAAAMRALQRLLAPPPDAIGVRWLDGSELGEKGPTVAGAIWLPARWPRDPYVNVRVPGGGGVPARRSLVVAGIAPALLGDVPVGGDLLALSDGPWAPLAEIAQRAALSMLSDAKAAGSETLASYRWDLRLLGLVDGDDPRARTADGRTLTAPEVLAELEARGHLWVTDRRGDPDGDFPGAAPAFVLHDPPVVDVLRHRTAPGILRDLGGALPDSPPLAPPNPPPLPPPDSPPDSPPGSPPDPSPDPSWVADLWEAVRSFFGRDEPPVETALTLALQRTLDALHLTGHPVVAIFEVRSGRPLRYEPAPRRLLLNTRHRALAWLSAGDPRAADPRAVILLAAAAVSEINRVLAGVIDMEERRTLAALMALAAAEAAADRGGGGGPRVPGG